MAGSWEPLIFRVRRDGSDGYTPTMKQRDAYLREHSPEMIARLKELGVVEVFGPGTSTRTIVDAVFQAVGGESART